MDEHVAQIFLTEIASQGESAFLAINEMNEAIASPGDGNRRFFRAAHYFLIHAAALSRILWADGSKEAVRARARHLRQLLGLPDEHVLKSRRLRNHIEHYDERLDDWIDKSRNHNIVVDMIGPRNAIGGDGIDDSDIFRSYDPATKTFYFRGERFDIQEIADGISEVYQHSAGELRRIWEQRFHGPA